MCKKERNGIHKYRLSALVVQPVETGDLKSLQCGFESHREYQKSAKVMTKFPFFLPYGRRGKVCRVWRFGEQVNTPGFDPETVGAVPTTAAIRKYISFTYLARTGKFW